MRALAAVLGVLRDLVVGDDWEIPLGVAVVLLAGGALVAWTGVDDTAVAVLVGAGIFSVVAASLVRARRA
jgi:hypothetical protein